MANTSDSCNVADAGDPDVAGLGVIIAFLVSMGVTATAIVLLYLWEFVADGRTNEIDKSITFFFPKLKTRQCCVSEGLQQLLRLQSDAVLGFGLSVLLVLYIRLSAPDDFSAYSFKIAATTVWLSCLSHMSTITFFRHDFHPDAGRTWRVVAMVVLLVLLAPILVISNLPTFIFNPSLSVRCAWGQISTYDPQKTRNFALVAASAMILVVTGYGSRILALYTRIPRRRSRLGGRHKADLLRGLRVRDNTTRWPQEIVVIRHRILFQLIQGLTESFFWELMWLAFYFMFALTSLMYAWSLVPPLNQWSLSFGQLLPGFVLFFTLPPAYDNFEECRNKHRTETAGTTARATGGDIQGSTRGTGGASSVGATMQSARTSSRHGAELRSLSNSDYPRNISLDPELNLTSSLDISLRVMGSSAWLFLGFVALIVFAWQTFMALSIGGAFFLAIDSSPPDIWAGFGSFLVFSAGAPVTGRVVKTSYDYYWAPEARNQRPEIPVEGEVRVHHDRPIQAEDGHGWFRLARPEIWFHRRPRHRRRGRSGRRYQLAAVT